jgi:NitT/TauT family transport system permease protein
MKTNKHLLYPLLSLVLFLCVLLVWEWCAATVPRIAFLFGAPSEVGRILIAETIHGALIKHFFVTGIEALGGFLIGIIAGTFIGLLLWYSSVVARIVQPYVLILGAVPAFAFAPVVIVWFGIGMEMKIALAAIGVFLVALTQAYEGARSVDVEEFRLLKLFGATRFQMLRLVIVPSVLQWIFASMKLSIGIALLGAFVGEFISSSQGLGYFMLRAGGLYDISAVFAGGVYLVALAGVLHVLVFLIEKQHCAIATFFSVKPVLWSRQ